MQSNPTGGGKDSLFSHRTGGDKDSLCKTLTGGGDSLCTVSWCIYPRSSLGTSKPSSGKQAKIVPTKMENLSTPLNTKYHHRRVQTTIQGKSNPVQDTMHNQRLRLFLVPKPGNRWRPVIDLSCLFKFLAVQKFKMETPESIQASLRRNEWDTSINVTDAYLHIPIHPQSQKYLWFCQKGFS